MLNGLPDQISLDPDSATADGASDTRRCHDGTVAPGAAAIIPPRENAKSWRPGTTGAVARNDALRSCRYPGQALWRRLTGYHFRSKDDPRQTPRPGPMARDFDRRRTELQGWIAGLDRDTAVGRPVTGAVERSRPLKGNVRSDLELGNEAVLIYSSEPSASFSRTISTMRSAPRIGGRTLSTLPFAVVR